jgi:hypothetical protein
MDKKLIIIVGLPCSGKTTLSTKFAKSHIIYDDFLQLYCNGNLIGDVSQGNFTCINDPRLCRFSVFLEIYNDLTQYINSQDIQIILFSNQKNHCTANALERYGTDELSIRKISNTIVHLSDMYNIKNYVDFCVEYNIDYVIRDVFHN